MITWNDWLKRQRIELEDWQVQAAKVFLAHIVEHQGSGEGKTFLVRQLQAVIGKKYFKGQKQPKIIWQNQPSTITLKDWQEQAVKEFLAHVEMGQEEKTMLLVNLLQDFIDSCGNNFCIS